MADIHSKLDALIDYFRMRSKGIETQLNFNPNGPTIPDSSSAIVVEDPIDDEMLEVYEFPDSEGKGDCESEIKHSVVEEKPSSSLVEAIKGINGMPDLEEIVTCESEIKHSIVEENEQDEENDDNGGGILPSVYIQSILGSGWEGTVNGSSSGLKAILSQNAIDHVARKVFDKMSQSFRVVLMDEQVNDPYTNGLNFNNITLFDPGGGREYAPSYSRGPLISKAHGTCINGMKGVVSSLKHALSTIVSGDKHCLTASNHFHIFSSGSHPIFALIMDIITLGDDFTETDLKALFEEGFKRVYCDMNSFGGNSNVKSTRESGSERLCDKGIDKILKNFAKLFLYVYFKNLAAYFDLEKLARLLLLDKSEIDRPKVGILTKLQQQHGDKFMSETDGIAAYFTLVCCDISSSPVCSWMVEFKELLHIRQLSIGSLRHDLIIIHVYWTKLAFRFLPSIQVTLPFDMNLELATNISRLINSLFALLHDMGKTNDMVDMVVLRVLDLYFEFPYDHAHNHPMESIEYSGWNTEKVTIAEQPLRNRKLADKINLASGIPNTRRQLIQAEFVAVLNGVKEDVYFDDESTEVVKSLLRLRDHHETLFINSSWIDCHDGVTGDAIGMLGNLKNFVWDPGSIRISHFTTLRTRRLLRGRICHVPRLEIRKITEESVGDVGYKLLAVNDVIVMSSLYLYRIYVT